MTPQEQIADLQNRIQHARRIVLDYREAIERGHVPSAEELEALAAMAKSIESAFAQMTALQDYLKRAESFIKAAPNN